MLLPFFFCCFICVCYFVSASCSLFILVPSSYVMLSFWNQKKKHNFRQWTWTQSITSLNTRDNVQRTTHLLAKSEFDIFNVYSFRHVNKKHAEFRLFLHIHLFFFLFCCFFFCYCALWWYGKMCKNLKWIQKTHEIQSLLLSLFVGLLKIQGHILKSWCVFFNLWIRTKWNFRRQSLKSLSRTNFSVQPESNFCISSKITMEEKQKKK